jgi:PRTRC genetic system protein E
LKKEKNMLFANLAALVAKGVTVQFTVLAAADGKLEVNVIPSVAGGTSSLNLVPKSFVATPEELDTEFQDVIAGYATANLTLKQQLEDVETVAAAAAKEASENAARKPTTTTKKSGAARPAVKSGGAGAPTLLDSEEDEDQDHDSGTGGSDEISTVGGGSQGAVQSEPLPLTL